MNRTKLKKVLDNKGYVSQLDREYELRSPAGEKIGTVSYRAAKAIESNTLDSYKPKNDEEKKVIDSFKAYNDELLKKDEDEKKQQVIDSNPIFKKYNIDPFNFNYPELEEWAKKHNHEIQFDSTGGVKLKPKKDGGLLGIGGNSIATKEEEEDAKVLTQLLSTNFTRNLAQTDIGATMSAVYGMMDGASFGFAGKAGDYGTKRQFDKSGLPEELYVKPSQAWEKTLSEHSVANLGGNIAGSLLVTVGVGNLVRAGTAKVFPKLANLGGKTTTALVQGTKAGTKATSATSKVLANMGKWISKSPVAQEIINDGITFSITSSAREAGHGGSASDVFQAGIIGLASGGISGGVEAKLGQIGLKFLFDKKLQHKVLPEIARVALSNAVGGTAYNVTSYALSPADKKPTVEDMVRDFAVDLAFGAIFSAKGTIDASKASKANLDNLYSKMERDFKMLAEINKAKSPDVNGMKQLAQNVIDYADTMQKLLKGEAVKTTIDGETMDIVMTDYRFIGQNDYVKSMIDDLDTIKGRAKDFLDVNRTVGDISGSNASTKANTESPIIRVGDVYSNSQNGEIYTVAKRDAESTTILVKDNDGGTITQKVSNADFDSKVLANDNVTMVKAGSINPTLSTEETSATVSEKETVETSVVSETPVTAPVVEQTTPVATEQRNTFTDELDEIASTEMPTVSVGETFIESGSNKIIKVIDRGDTHATVEITTPSGAKETKQLRLAAVDNMAVDDRYTKVETSADTTIEKSGTVADNTTTTPQSKMSSVKVGDVYKTNGKTYTITSRDNGRTKYTVTDENGKVITRETSNVTADINFTKEDSFTKVQDGNTVTSTEAENVPVTEETTTDSGTVSNIDVDATDAEISIVVDAMEETLNAGALDAIYESMPPKLEKSLDTFANSLIRLYKKHGNIGHIAEFFSDGGDKVVTAIEVGSSAKVLQNQSESATIKEKTEDSSVEREENSNEQGRADLLYDNGKRGNNGSSKKQTERLLSFRRRNQGKNATERQNFARELIERGQVEEVIDENTRYILVKPEAYNDEMSAMVEDAKRRGVELRFFVGRMEVEVELDDGTKVTKLMSGLALPSSQVAYVQYDDVVESPQQIYKHELCHTKWYSPEMQKIKNTILNTLTEAEKQKIKQTQRFKDYMTAYKNKERICWEEFVCDVMSGKTQYTSNFIDTAYDYWYGNEGIDSYNPADYTNSIDAGGTNTINKKPSKKANENKSTAKRLAKVRSSRYNLAAVDSHKNTLEKKFDAKQSDIDYDTLIDRYNAVIGIWEKIGIKLDSQVIKDWDAKKGTDRAFTLFKEQTGYKYNIELSTMCKKGIPIFEAIDTIVKKEISKKLNTDKIGKAEKEILYDILKTRGFEIPCAICYVEQARQREGDIINAFCDGKAEEGKLGWNGVLKSIENAMKSKGVNYTFPSLDRSVATDNYVPQSIAMSEMEQDAFYESLVDLTNEEIERSNKTAKNKRNKISSTDPGEVNDVLKGTLSSNLKIFQVLFNNPDSRFKIDNDLLYSSSTTMNLAYAHQPLYSLFNSQGGVSTFKTKQKPMVYWGDILSRTWTSESTREEGGIRSQSNSDTQMYTFLDEAQRYIDMTAKGYYSHEYTKVLPKLKLFGKSNVKMNASFIPRVVEYKNAYGTVDIEKTRENAGLDENGNLLFDGREGVNPNEALMLMEDAEYSKSLTGICIGYSDKQILKLLDEPKIQLIIGFHDKTDNPDKRYVGAKYSKNYNNENEATRKDNGKTVHDIKFNDIVAKAEKMFKYNEAIENFEGTTTFKGKEYKANDIPKLAVAMYLDECDRRGLNPAYSTGETDFSTHENYYKLLGDFGLYDSEGNYAPHRKVVFNLPDQVPYLDENGNKAYMPTEDYILQEVREEVKLMDSIAEAMADESDDGIMAEFVRRVNEDDGKRYNIAEEGNVEDEKTRDNRKRTGRVSKRIENQRRRDSGNSENLSDGNPKGEIQSSGGKVDGKGQTIAKRSRVGSVDRVVPTSDSAFSPGRTRTEGERFLVALREGDDETARTLLNEQAVKSGFVPAHMYHGTLSDDVFTQFESEVGIHWVTPSLKYAEKYTDGYYGDDIKAAQLFTEPDSGVYDLYIKPGKVLDVGNINLNYDNLDVIDDFRRRIGFSNEEFNLCWGEGKKHEHRQIWTIVHTPSFAKIAREHGYDSIRATERNGVQTYGCLYPENLKSANLETFDDNGQLVPLEERFNEGNDDIRYNLANKSGYPEWTEDVLDDFEFGKLESALLDIESGTNANYYNRSASGEYIIQTDNKLIYTDGNYSKPEISKIIEFNSEYESEIDEMRRLIYEAEKGKSELEMAYRIIEGAFGQGSVITHNRHSNTANGKSTGLRKGNVSKGNSPNGGTKKQRRSRYVEEIRGASKQGLKAIQRTSRKLKKSGIRYNIADVDSNGNTFANDGSNTNSIDTGDNDVVLDVIGLGDEYRLSESGELNENTNAIGMEERGTYQNNDSVWQRSEDKVTETPEGKKITVGMSDDTRAELLSKKSINVVSFDVEKAKALGDMDFDALQKTLTRHAKPIIEKVAKDFGILNKTYFNPDIELDFEYSRGSLKESVNKQHTMYGDFVKMLSVFPDVIKNAVGIETHKDKYVGTVREDASLKQMYVLASALSDETGIIPVKLEVKEFNDKANKLYLSVVLTKKESRYPHGNLEQSPLNTATPASTISIADLVGIVNPSEGDFLKYFPDKMLDSEQIESKNKALTKDAEKVEKLKKSGVRYSITDIDSDGNAFADDGSTSTNSIDTGGNDVVLDVIGLGDEYRLSESGELNENTNAIGMEERGTYQNNDSVWQRSEDSEGLYRSVGNGKSMLRRSEEKGLGFIDWSRKFGNLNVNDPKEKGRAYGILRKISELKIADKDSLGRKLPKAIKEHFGQTVLKNSKGELVALYHATDEKFDIFKYGDFGFHIGNWEQATHLNKKFIKEVYVDVRNPMYIPVDSMHWYGIVIASRALSQDIINRNEYDSISKLDGFFGMDYNSDANIALRELLKEKGYDGIIYNNGFEEKGISVIAFDSNQIKYTSNRNPSANDDARYSLATDGILDLEDLWEDAKARYGTIPKGEKPVRDVDVPKKISEKDVVSQHARTMIEAGVTPDWAVSEFEQRILDGTMTHEVLTNKKANTWAREQIEHLGFEEALNRWSVWSDSGKVGKKELALGQELYNQCITNKDVHNAMKIASELVTEATHAGQTLQATRMLKLMTPDVQLYYLEKSIQKMNEEFREKLGDKYKDIELDESLMEEFLTEKDEEKRNEVYDRVCQHIADQIPATKLDKWNSWRYLAMLGNPRTHLRNIIGNAVFIPSIRLKNYIGAVIEEIAKVDVSERTKSLRKSKEAVAFAKKDAEKMLKALQGENAKYAVTGDIQGKRTIFKTKWLEKLRLKNFDFLEMEDTWFLKIHYADALARLITARKIDVNSITPESLETLRAYAIKEAQAATYRDANALADGLNRLQKKLEHSDKKAIRATSVLVEGVMPFKKTPLNIAKQGINYSPIGILKGTYKAFAKLKKSDAAVTEVIDDLSKGLSGTMVMLLGYFLASMGWLGGDEDKSKKEKEFDKMVGEQLYALKFGDAFSYTIDWMTPSNLSLFVGAKLYDLTKEDFEFADVVGALSTVSEPLLELSVFSGVNGVIESAQYSDSEALLAIGSDMITSYFMQALPTIGGQISRIVDGSKREYYYADKNSAIPQGLQRFIGQASSKIPFASFLFQPAVDEWGREETYGNVAERAFENTISPGYYSKDNYTRVDKELKKLHEKTGDNAVLPTIQQKQYTEDYVVYHMSAKDYTEAKKIRGKKSFQLVSELLSSKKYSQMADDEKVKAIKKCYEEAGDYAKEKMLEKVKRSAK